MADEGIEVPAFPGIANLTVEDWADLQEIAGDLGSGPECIAAVISRESRFQTTAKNPKSTASGILQWIEVAARGLGTTTEAIRRMTMAEQLALAKRHFKNLARTVPSAVDLQECGQVYLLNFLPFRIHPKHGNPLSPLQSTLTMGDDDVIAEAGSKVYEANKHLDTSKKGAITAGDVRGAIKIPAKTVRLVARRTAVKSEGVDFSLSNVLPVAVGLLAAWAIARRMRR